MAPTMRRERLATGVLLGAALAALFGGSWGESVFLSPPGNLLSNPLLSGPSHLASILSPEFAMFTEGQYRPLSYAVLALLRGVVPADATSFWQAVLLVTHWLAAFLLARLVRRLGGALGPSLFAGALFVVHPLVSVFAADAGLYHFTLGWVLYLGAMHLYLRAGQGDGGRALAGCLALYLLGVLTTKAVFTWPLVLLAYEGLYRRSGWRYTARRVALFVVPTALLAPFWWLVAPHPLHYSYIVFPPGSTWFTFYSVVSATEYYARGLLLGAHVPVPLHELVPQIYSLASGRFWALLLANAAVLIAGLVLTRRRQWGGLGLLLIFAVMVPYASTTLNNAEDYVAWKYLYPVLGGFALFAGWLAATPSGGGRGRRLLAGALVLTIPLFAWQQGRLNRLTATEVGYWEHIHELFPGSETANVALGTALLARGELEEARARLFDPSVEELYDSAKAMCQYYVRRGEVLPAAVHLRMALRQGQGLQFGHGEPLMAEVMDAAGALDHAEGALGKVLTSNPYDLAAMERLAGIWVRKGFVLAADKLRQRIEALDPDADEARRVAALVAERRQKAGREEVIAPPSPSWLRYAANGSQDGVIRRQIIAESPAHAGDPIIGVEMASCLVSEGDHARALKQMRAVTAAMPGWALGWAMQSWVASEADELEEAIAAGQRALELDNRDATVHNSLGILQARLANRNPQDRAARTRAVEYFAESMRLNPRNVSAFVNLGKEMARLGESDQAVAFYRRALRLRPDLAEANFGMANLRADQGDLVEAVDYYRKALRARREYPEASYNLGLALARQEKFAEAEESFAQALAQRPEYSPARDALATLCMQQGRFGQAIAVLKEGARLVPGHIRGSLMLATLLASCPDPRHRDPRAAVALAESLCRALRYQNSDALLVLAEVRAETGDLAGAAREASLALQVADATGRPQHVARIEQRLQVFRRRLAGAEQH